MKSLPHENVWCRIGVSNIHGVGVIAIAAITAGTNVFENDQGAIVWVDEAEVASLPEHSTLKCLYRDFAIHRDGKLGCPANFNVMGVGWYVNQPLPDEAANLVIGPEYAMIASRDIAEGEELTILYDTFSRRALPS